MPELPEVETVKRGLASTLVGHTIIKATLNRADLRIPFPRGFSKNLEGKQVIKIERRAKYLLIHLTGDQVLIVHLGMSGKLLYKESGKSYKPTTHDHVLLALDKGALVIFNDPRRFGLMTLCKESELTAHPFFAHLGPEPLEKGFSAAYLKSKLKSRKAAIKLALMDQELVVGVGNIYASEALFRAKVSPQTPAIRAANKSAALVAAIREILNAAIASGGSTLRDYVRSSGDVGYFQHHFSVYGREGESCEGCKTAIKKIVQGARSTYFCPSCQR